MCECESTSLQSCLSVDDDASFNEIDDMRYVALDMFNLSPIHDASFSLMSIDFLDDFFLNHLSRNAGIQQVSRIESALLDE